MSTEGLIALLEKKRNHLSKIENQVLDYILTHMTEVVHKPFMRWRRRCLSQQPLFLGQQNT